MHIKFIGITGGSGVGKSTLCFALKNKYPDKIEVIQLDDYFKPKDERPMVEDIVNCDHPDSLYLDKLADDLKKLAKGGSVIIETKNTILNPEYVKTKKKIPVEFFPKPIILVEGFLVLYNEEVRQILDTSIFLDLEHNARWERRVDWGNKNEEYEEKVIIPMHTEFTEPTKKYAKHIIDVSGLKERQVLEQVEKIIGL